jgi:hypothetical protein
VTRIALAAALLVTNSALPPVQQAPGATGQIAGRLVSADRGQPVRKAQIKLVALSPRQAVTAVTDAEGRFGFSGLPAGEYSLSAAKPGFLESVYGALRPGPAIPGVTLRLAAGQVLNDLVFRLPRGGAIAGIVSDEFGDPAYNVPVRAVRFTYENGLRVPRPAGNATTDDLGSYRIAGLLPGEYVVSAVPRESVAAAAASAESLRNRQAQILAEAKRDGSERAAAASFERARRELGRDPAAPPEPVGYVATYHPSSPNGTSAARVRLGTSEQMTAVDIQLLSLRTSTIRGAVMGPTGGAASATVYLIDPAMPIPGVATWFTRTDANGRFAFHGVPPGTYVALTQAPTGKPGQELTASTDVHAGDGGTLDITLTLKAGVTASGSLDLDTLRGVDVRRLQIDLLRILSPADWEVPLGTSVVDTEGRFAIGGLAPGSYRFSVRGLPDGWRLDSAMVDSIETADHNLRIDSRPIGGVVLKFVRGGAQISGVASNPSGPVTDHAVLLFPADRDLWVPQSRRIHVAQPDADGRYTIRNLPAGDYRLALVVPPETGQQFDREFLAQAVSGSLAVTLAAGEQKTQDVRGR